MEALLRPYNLGATQWYVLHQLASEGRKRDRTAAYRFLVWLGIGVHLMSRWTPDESDQREAARLAC